MKKVLIPLVLSIVCFCTSGCSTDALKITRDYEEMAWKTLTSKEFKSLEDKLIPSYKKCNVGYGVTRQFESLTLSGNSGSKEIEVVDKKLVTTTKDGHWLNIIDLYIKEYDAFKPSTFTGELKALGFTYSDYSIGKCDNFYRILFDLSVFSGSNVDIGSYLSYILDENFLPVYITCYTLDKVFIKYRQYNYYSFLWQE